MKKVNLKKRNVTGVRKLVHKAKVINENVSIFNQNSFFWLFTQSVFFGCLLNLVLSPVSDHFSFIRTFSLFQIFPVFFPFQTISTFILRPLRRPRVVLLPDIETKTTEATPAKPVYAPGPQRQSQHARRPLDIGALL